MEALGNRAGGTIDTPRLPPGFRRPSGTRLSVRRIPALETPGYYQMSLRDFRDETYR